ncbi:MAG: ankyrin repeat domain-containing protein [Lachnospiraceae bacterium]|nr:ankyrin repeat domain-containing protein [Lachnospiraceae bacterium]
MTKEQIEMGISYAGMKDIGKLSQWLSDGNDSNQYDQNGWTPLLWAAAKGNYKAVEMLLKNGADISMSHKISFALPIHMAGHSGDVKTAEILLDYKPEDIDAVWDLNGHTILLQASFYGHLELANFLVKKGASTVITTARGLGPMEMAKQFQNHELMNILSPYDSSQEEKVKYYQSYLKRITPIIPEDEKEEQELSNQLVEVIEKGIAAAFHDSEAEEICMKKIRELVEIKKADVNRLGGVLQQPPLIVAVTGNNGLPSVKRVADIRYAIVHYLLMNGANPTLHEKHPMGAQSIIRAAVFNHLDILKLFAEYISKEALTNAINEIPIVNGLTALHDTVLRATTAKEDKIEGYLAQCKWFMNHGGRSDIEDFSGLTQKNIAERCSREEIRRELMKIL